MPLRTFAPLAAAALAATVLTAAAFSAPAVENTAPYQSLLHSIIQSDVPGAKRLLGQGLDPNARVHAAEEDAWITDASSPPDQPLLVVAARFGVPDAPFVAMLLEHKATVDIRDSRKWTPLMYAAQLGWSPTLELLLKQKADVNAADAQGVTVLMHAMGNRSLGTVASLLDHGAKINASDDQGKTPLMHAVMTSRGDPLRLYGRKDDPAAADARYLELVRYLIEHKADVRRRDKGGSTALTLARSAGLAEMIALLKQAGATE